MALQRRSNFKPNYERFAFYTSSTANAVPLPLKGKAFEGSRMVWCEHGSGGAGGREGGAKNEGTEAVPS